MTMQGFFFFTSFILLHLIFLFIGTFLKLTASEYMRFSKRIFMHMENAEAQIWEIAKYMRFKRVGIISKQNTKINP